MTFREFPDDDAFYVIKWMDRYASTARRSVSMSFDVVLQRLLQTSLREIQRLSVTEVQEILGKPSADAPAPIDPRDRFGQKRWPTVVRRCHAGLLPLMHIGDVVHKRKLVGRLPQQEFALRLDRGSACGEDYALGQPVPGLGWRGARGSRTALGRYQYELPWGLMDRSRVFVVSAGGIECILPHNVIFQGLYAVNSALARAFTEGPWHATRHDIVRPDPMENGLATYADPQGRFWTIVLRTEVLFGCERLVAILYHDPQANANANSIYACAEKDRQESRKLVSARRWVDPREWYITARLPLGECASKLKIHGITLRDGALEDGSVLRQVLATRLVGCNEPAHIPPIFYERENSGEVGADPQVSDEPKPYSGKPRGGTPEHLRHETEVTEDDDADAQGAVHRVDGSEFAWEDAKPMEKIVKETSTHYTGPGGWRPQRPPTDVVSAGFRMPGDSRGVDPLTAETLVRAPSRLKLAWSAFKRLQQAGKIISFQAIPAADQIARADRGEFECWNFLDPDERAQVVRPPTRGWRVIEHKGNWPILRAALVCHVRLEKGGCLWFELECRAAEKYCSLLVGPVADPSDEMIYDCLFEIARARNPGRNMKESVATRIKAYRARATEYVHVLSKVENDQGVNDTGDEPTRSLKDDGVLGALCRALSDD